jgi:hypothetical protein
MMRCVVSGKKVWTKGKVIFRDRQYLLVVLGSGIKKGSFGIQK